MSSVDRATRAADEAGSFILAKMTEQAERAERASKIATRAAWAMTAICLVAAMGLAWGAGVFAALL